MGAIIQSDAHPPSPSNNKLSVAQLIEKVFASGLWESKMPDYVIDPDGFSGVSNEDKHLFRLVWQSVPWPLADALYTLTRIKLRLDFDLLRL